MFERIVNTLFWISFFAAMSAGSYFLCVGGDDSLACHSVRWVDEMAPVAPIPVGFCGVTEPESGYDIPKLEIPPDISVGRTGDEQLPVYDEFDRQQVIEIGPGCVFSPSSVEVSEDTHVLWLNADTVNHAIVSGDGKTEVLPIDSFASPTILPGKQYKLYVSRPGRYVYRCPDFPESYGEFTVRLR